MALLRYLQSKDNLPNPRGTLSSSMPSQAIAAANREVRKAAEIEKKHGPYKKYSASERADIGNYAIQHGVAAASRVFSSKLKLVISETTVRSIKDAYLKEIKRKRSSDPDNQQEIRSLPVKKRGRPVLLGNDLDSKVQHYLRKVREAGGTVSSRTVMAAARGIVMSYNRDLLTGFGGPVLLNRYWAHSLLQRMNFVQRKATTAKSKESIASFLASKESFLEEVTQTVLMEEIPPELILNWDQTGIKIIPTSTWTMEQRGARRVEMVGVNDKRQITAVFCGSLVGDFLPIQLIYKGKTSRCHPKFQFPEGWDITHAPNHWSNEFTMIQYINNIVVPYIVKVREQFSDTTPALVIMDNFKGQITDPVLSLLESNNIHTCLLPPNTTDRLQPMDISVNKPAKDFIRQKFDGWYAEQVMSQLNEDDNAPVKPVDFTLPIMRELSAKWIVEMASYISDHPSIIVNGFIRSGITGAIDGDACEEDVQDESELSSDSEAECHSNESLDEFNMEEDMLDQDNTMCNNEGTMPELEIDPTDDDICVDNEVIVIS